MVPGALPAAGGFGRFCVHIDASVCSPEASAAGARSVHKEAPRGSLFVADATKGMHHTIGSSAAVKFSFDHARWGCPDITDGIRE
eukprot:gene19340-biopygen2493